MALHGKTVHHGEALDAALFRVAFPPETLLDAARTLAAETIDNTAPVSVALTRQLVWRMLVAAHPMDAHIAESRGMRAQGSSSDAYEGVTSFLEKPPARFTRTVSSDLPEIFPGWVSPEYR
jgi:enoyl-CoA hydratase/carnithine racemase